MFFLVAKRSTVEAYENEVKALSLVSTIKHNVTMSLGATSTSITVTILSLEY